MAKKKPSKWKFLQSSYATDAEHTEELLNEIIFSMNRIEDTLPEMRRHLREKPHWPRPAKDLAISVYKNLQTVIVHAATMREVSQLPRLPEHGEFREAHSLHRAFDVAIERAKKVRHALLKATYGSDSIAIGQALDATEHELRAPLPS